MIRMTSFRAGGSAADNRGFTAGVLAPIWTRQASRKALQRKEKVEAPLGFEPGMEVLQSGRPVTRFVRKQAQNERSQSHANRSLYAPVRRNGQQYAPNGIKNGITFGRLEGRGQITPSSYEPLCGFSSPEGEGRPERVTLGQA